MFAIRWLGVVVLLAGCPKRVPAPIPDEDPVLAEAPARAAPASSTQAWPVKPWVEEDWTAALAQVDPALPRGDARVVPELDYVCDKVRTDSQCREIGHTLSSLVRRGVQAVGQACEQDGGGRFGVGAGGATCPDGYIASCRTVSGDQITHYYPYGGAPYSLATAQSHCLTIGNWEPVK
jgi:hypothetical protein